MSKLTTLGIGGPAKYFYVAKTQKSLLKAVAWAKDKHLKYLVVGSGSNLLVSDKGFDGLVIKNELSGIVAEGPFLKVQSGTPLQKLIDFTIKHGLGGMNLLTGIPGTVGGAIYGNAGAFGQTISDCVKAVTCLGLFYLSKQECGFAYRDSILKRNKHIILEVEFSLPSADKTILKQESKDILEKRKKKYPSGILCPGSFFKNIIAADLPVKIVQKIPKEKIVYGKIPAGGLIELVGGKGDRIGRIQIAQNHGNTFINLGGGTAKDFYRLAKKYQIAVKEKFGINLEPEVQLINLPSISS